MNCAEHAVSSSGRKGGRKNLGAMLALLVAAAPAASRAQDFGAFLNAQFAVSQGHYDFASDEIAAALKADPSSAFLEKGAFGLALIAGSPDLEKLAAGLPHNEMAELVLANAEARAGRWQHAELLYAELPHSGINDLLRPVLVAWAQAAQGDAERALGTLQDAMSGAHSPGFYALHAALIADVGRRDGVADRLYGQVAHNENTAPNVRMTQIIASWQARTGRLSAARDTIDALIKSAPELAMVRPALIAADQRPAVPDALTGIAEAYTGLAGALRSQKDSDAPLVLLQIGLRVAPHLTEALLLRAEVLGAAKHWHAAAASLEQVPQDDPLRPVITLHLASYLSRAGDSARAEQVLLALAKQFPDQPEPESALGDAYFAARKYPDAVAAYSHAITLTPKPTAADWGLFYARGAAQERVHDLAGAEADMRQALALDPSQPAVLNFLGYSWAEQNRNLDEAHAFIARAMEARPHDGEITDSLGWVNFRQGHIAEAVKLLEKAAELQPDDATITGHLGDAYWAEGRKVEAQDQWRRALVLNPEPEEAARIEARLKTAAP